MAETNLKSMLSSLVDGEASEIETHRLVREFDDSLRENALRYAHVGSVMRGESTLPLAAHMALNTRILAALDDEPALSGSAPLPSTGAVLRQPRVAIGLAASVVVAVAAGFFVQFSGDPAAPDVALADAVPEQVARNAVSAPTTAPIAARTVSTAGALPRGDRPVRGGLVGDVSLSDSELRQLDDEKQRVLRAYLNRHEQATRIYAQTPREPGDR